MAIDQDDGEWLTYAAVGQALGISSEAARQLAKRRGWPRRTPNEHNALALVYVPKDAKSGRRPALNGGRTPFDRGTIDRRDRPDERPDESVIQAIMNALALCREQIERERGRVDRAERLLEEEQKRSGELEALLADAVGAERIAAGEAAGLRAEVERLTAERRRPWWRRWFQ